MFLGRGMKLDGLYPHLQEVATSLATPLTSVCVCGCVGLCVCVCVLRMHWAGSILYLIFSLTRDSPQTELSHCPQRMRLLGF